MDEFAFLALLDPFDKQAKLLLDLIIGLVIEIRDASLDIENGRLVGDCAITTIIKITARVEGTSAHDTGSAIVYANDVSGVSYGYVPAVHASLIGDQVRLCLVSIFKNYPPVGTAGKEYQATNLRTGNGYSSDYIRQIAPYYGVDPNAAIAIFNKETGGNSNFIGDMGSSFGPFQLHYGGMVPGVPRLNNPGLGDEFTATTGLTASDPSTWQAQVEFSLYKDSAGGWTPWSTMSAAGLHKWSGIDKAKTVAMHLRIIFRTTVLDAILLASASLHKTSNHTISAAPTSVQPTFLRLAGHQPTCGLDQDLTTNTNSLKAGLV